LLDEKSFEALDDNARAEITQTALDQVGAQREGNLVPCYILQPGQLPGGDGAPSERRRSLAIRQPGFPSASTHRVGVVFIGEFLFCELSAGSPQASLRHGESDGGFVRRR
jgi:hypothetical protein